MGRYHFGKKSTVEDSLVLSVFWLRKHGYFDYDGYKSGGITWTWSLSGHSSSIGFSVVTGDANYIDLRYALTPHDSDEKEHYDYRVQLVTTDCRYGGKRYWFVCPLVNNDMPCRRRVGKIYSPPGAKYFGCRHCYDLTYDARQSHNKRFDGLKRFFDAEKRLEKLHDRVKRKYYRGRPTKKYREYLSLLQQIEGHEPLLEAFMEGLYKR